ncbi:MAG: HAD hydrolase-like protein [Clostridiales bacterium]|nr:HAD hydrolase-like protein [Clostridiales bacterium]
MKYDAILFDVDGTLLDTSEGILLSLKQTLDRFGIDYSFLTEEDNSSFIGPPMELSLTKWFNLTGDKNTEVCSGYRKTYREDNIMLATPYEGIEQALDNLRNSGIALGVASYKKQDYLGKILEGFGMDKYFDVICGSDYTGKLTKADIINCCISGLKIEDKSRVLMIGDTTYDSSGAKEAGVDFAFARWGFGEVPEEDYVMCVDVPSDLAGALL